MQQNYFFFVWIDVYDDDDNDKIAILYTVKWDWDIIKVTFYKFQVSIYWSIWILYSYKF